MDLVENIYSHKDDFWFVIKGVCTAKLHPLYTKGKYRVDEMPKPFHELICGFYVKKFWLNGAKKMNCN